MQHKTKKSVFRTELTPVSFLHRSSYLFPYKTAVVHGDRRYTYREFEERVNRLASHLRRLGLKKHEKVAFLCPNIPALLEAHFAVPAAGGILVTINIRLNSNEIGYMLEHSRARFLFVDLESEPLIDQLDTSHIHVVRVDDTGEDDDPYEMFIAEGSPKPFESWLDDEEEPISLNYTSGTTGQPKGVIYTHRGAYLNALGSVVEIGMNSTTVYLWTLPMFHCNGWCFTWAVTAVAGTHICLRKADPEKIWDLINKENVTHLNGTPTVFNVLVNHTKAKAVNHPVTVTLGGAPPSPTLLEKIKILNFQPIHTYGLTETYGPYTICEWHSEWDNFPLDEQARLRARQGQAYITADLVRVVDEQMNDIPRDGKTMGEVLMRGNNVMKKYFNDPETTNHLFRDGWFHTGDLAVWHPDEYIELRDRLKDIIISGGENISTIEVEQAIVKHPAVLECAVVGFPDEKWGERPKAFISLKKGARVTESEIITFCKTRIARFKCPDSVVFGDIPKTSTGKVQKYLLRKREGGE